MFKFLKNRFKELVNKFKKVEKEEVIESKEEKEIKKKSEEVKEGKLKKFKEIFTHIKISEDKFEKIFEEFELHLLESNVAFEVVEKIKEELKNKIVNVPIEHKKLDQVIKSELKNIIKDLFVEPFDLIELIKNSKKPFVIAFFGVNGSGKTTTIAKLAYYLNKNNISCVISASDTFRAAAIQQLEEHAKNINVKVIKHDYGSDPTAVAYDTLNYAKAKNIDVVLIDTAGRMHSNVNLMDELKKLTRVIKPNLKIFVGESITGNDCIEQCKQFNEHIGIDAIILTKSDVDEKGGTLISVSYIAKKPIIFIGTGQNYNDLKKFDINEFISSLF